MKSHVASATNAVIISDHKTTVDVHMFNSCFHLEPASQGRDILEVNLCTPHYQKYKNYETLQSCYMKVEKDVCCVVK
jgi:CRISPR/Cas system CMR subunit Cmr6 (Cas7 group RAMP superfamily)